MERRWRAANTWSRRSKITLCSRVLLKRIRSEEATFLPAYARSSAAIAQGSSAWFCPTMTSSMMSFPRSQGGRSSMAAAVAAHAKVRTASRRYGLLKRRTRSRDCKASVRFDILAVPIEVFYPHPDRTPHLAAQPVNAETSLPAFSSHRGVAEDFRVDHDGSREAALALALHDHNLLRTEHLRCRQADAL